MARSYRHSMKVPLASSGDGESTARIYLSQDQILSHVSRLF